MIQLQFLLNGESRTLWPWTILLDLFSLFFYFGLFLFHNCTRCLFCVRSVLFFLKCYHSSCSFVWGTIAQSTVSNILRINSFTPRSNQFVIYPYHLDTLSSRKMMWSIKKKLSICAYCLNWHQELWSKIRVRPLFIAGGREGILAVAIKFTWSLMRRCSILTFSFTGSHSSIAVPFFYVRDDWFPHHYPWQLCDPTRKNIPIPPPFTNEK